MPVPRAKNDSELKVEDHMGLVRAVVNKYYRKGRLEDSELYSVGCLALVDAARTYDPSKSKFCTWATRLISQRVVDEFRKALKERERADQDALDAAEASKSEDPIHLVHAMVDVAESDSESESDSKSVLRKYYLEEKSLSEIGREFGISKEGVRKRLKSAILCVRRKNRELLENVL